MTNDDNNSHPHITIGGTEVELLAERPPDAPGARSGGLSADAYRIQVETPPDHVPSLMEDSNQGFKIALLIGVLALIGAGAVLVLIWRLVRVSRKLL